MMDILVGNTMVNMVDKMGLHGIFMEIMGWIWWLIIVNIGLFNLVGGAITILKKNEFVNGKDDIPYMKWTLKNVPNHQPD